MNLTLTAGQAARYCGMSLPTFRAARARGEGPAVFTAHGGRPRFAISQLDAWMDGRRDPDPLAKAGAA